MTTTEPNVPDTSRYGVTEAANILGIARSTLRLHSDAGFIRYGIRRCNGRRVYTGRELKRYWRL